MRTVGAGEIDGRAGRRDVERDAVVGGGERLQVGADLVGDVPVGGDAVGADDHRIDLAVAHQEAGRVVGDEGAGNAVLVEFPGCQQALVARPGFGDPDMHRDAGVVRGIDGGERGAAVDRRQPAGIAVGHDMQRVAARDQLLAPQGEAVGADGGVLGDVFVGDGGGLGPSGGGAGFRRQRGERRLHARQRPVQIDRRRTRRPQQRGRFGEAPVGRLEGECDGHPVGGRGADQRRAADLHGADGVRGLFERRDPDPVQRVRQAGLVDDVDGALLGAGAQRAGGDAVDVHGCALWHSEMPDTSADPPWTLRSESIPASRTWGRPSSPSCRVSLRSAGR